jgi:hypothetical protein
LDLTKGKDPPRFKTRREMKRWKTMKMPNKIILPLRWETTYANISLNPKTIFKVDVVTQELYDHFNVVATNLVSINKCGIGMQTKTKEHEVAFKTSKHLRKVKLPKSTN